MWTVSRSARTARIEIYTQVKNGVIAGCRGPQGPRGLKFSMSSRLTFGTLRVAVRKDRED